MVSHIFRLEGVVVKIDDGLGANDISFSSSHYFYESRDIIFYLRHALQYHAGRARPTARKKKINVTLELCPFWFDDQMLGRNKIKNGETNLT